MPGCTSGGPLGDQQARVGVAQVVKPYAAETSTLRRLGKLPMAEVIGVERRASLTAEDKVRASVDGFEGPKGLLEGRRHVNGAPGPSRLGCAEDRIEFDRRAAVDDGYGEVDLREETTRARGRLARCPVSRIPSRISGIPSPVCSTRGVSSAAWGGDRLDARLRRGQLRTGRRALPLNRSPERE